MAPGLAVPSVSFSGAQSTSASNCSPADRGQRRAFRERWGAPDEMTCLISWDSMRLNRPTLEKKLNEGRFLVLCPPSVSSNCPGRDLFHCGLSGALLTANGRSLLGEPCLYFTFTLSRSLFPFFLSPERIRWAAVKQSLQQWLWHEQYQW